MPEPTLEQLASYINTPRAIRRGFQKQTGNTAPTQEQAIALFCTILLKRLRLLEQTLAAKGIVVEERTSTGLIKIPGT